MRSIKVDRKAMGMAPGLVLLILVLVGNLTLYASAYTVILVTSILMYVILTMSWVLFAGPTGYVSLATARVLWGRRLYFGHPGEATPCSSSCLGGGVCMFCHCPSRGRLDC